jgi:hypothetical protein
MAYQYTDIDNLKTQIYTHLKAFKIFDIPEGRHQAIVEEFYVVQKNRDSDEFDDKLRYVNDNLLLFNKFLEKQGKLKSDRIDAERQAQLEPERTKTAIKTLTEMGFKVKVVSNTEINFTYKGEKIKYFPYSGWASGKSIKDGRGFKNLVAQLGTESEDLSQP